MSARANPLAVAHALRASHGNRCSGSMQRRRSQARLRNLRKFGDVLVEFSAEGHSEKLHSPANRENWHVQGECRASNRSSNLSPWRFTRCAERLYSWYRIGSTSSSNLLMKSRRPIVNRSLSQSRSPGEPAPRTNNLPRSVTRRESDLSELWDEFENRA